MHYLSQIEDKIKIRKTDKFEINKKAMKKSNKFLLIKDV